ncbi:MAG TPA: hydroxymethylglutaryl-CoA reductase [Myxococcales bacterium]|nr:hydroxymethylglutaryl-CoA reductase [Myxococcales bacterium]
MERAVSGAMAGGAAAAAPRRRIPRSDQDYTEEMAAQRRAFAREQTGANLSHLAHYDLDPASVSGNIENFIGVAQVPIGLAGPLRVRGEHANGDFYVPLATTEGTLVASYNRGMRVLTACGGVRATVVERSMQRGPVFMFSDAVAARDFGRWVSEHLASIRGAAEATTRVGKLVDIGQYQVGPLRYLRFNYTTGDAAGQNMTGKATYAACQWIKASHPDRLQYILSGNIDTDKKHSQMNVLQTRGRRVVAEAVLRKDVLEQIVGVSPKKFFHHRQISQAGTFLAGSANNGAHAANALAALFIATGQDAANVAESHAAITYSQLLDDGDYYWSITLPSLIVATYGGGTSLGTQKQCLELLGCTGQGSADKFAEICAAVVLAGEISLAGAILHDDWVSSHERLGRNRK